MSPFQCVYDPVLRTYFIAFVGRVTPDDSLAMVHYLNRDPNFRECTSVLLDLTGCVLTEDNSPSMRGMLGSAFKEETIAHILNVRVAVAGLEGDCAIWARFYLDNMHSTSYGFFDKTEGARAWLGLPGLLPA